ncbi:MAG: hypothetical protein OEU26_26575 [Candidatus Tectomicrobia bacterium]|nr:hypothetical protein [Candidatus Tectomicrobia bacterium]
MSLRGQQDKLRRRAQAQLEELQAGTVVIGEQEYGVAAAGVTERKELIDGREVVSRDMRIRLRKALYPAKPTEGEVITFIDEDGEEQEWRIGQIQHHAQDPAWHVTLYEPSEARGG